MRRVVTIFGLLVLAAASFAVPAAGNERPAPGATACAPTGKAAFDPTRHELQVLGSGEAEGLLDSRKRANPRLAAALAASEAAFAKKGWKRKGVVQAYRIRAKNSARKSSVAHRVLRFFFPTVHAQEFPSYFEEPINGVGIMTAWDDGDDATWEGTSYFENYDTGQWALIDNQMDVETETRWIRWANTRDAEPRDRERTREGDLEYAPIAFRSGAPQGLSHPTACTCDLAYASRRTLPANCMMATALDRSVITCGVAFAGCRRTGPFAWGCTGVMCGANFVGQFLAEMYRWGRDCAGMF